MYKYTTGIYYIIDRLQCVLFVLIFPVPGGILDAYMNYEFHTAKGEETSNGANKEKKKVFIFKKSKHFQNERRANNRLQKQSWFFILFSLRVCIEKCWAHQLITPPWTPLDQLNQQLFWIGSDCLFINPFHWLFSLSPLKQFSLLNGMYNNMYKQDVILVNSFSSRSWPAALV